MVRRFRSPLLWILLLTACVYGATLTNGFVNLDDPLLVTGNPHVLSPSFANVWYVFTHFDPELYIPVTFLSYQLEVWTLGLHAWHLHLFSLLVHFGCIALIYAIAKKLSASTVTAIITASLFALHPINAEAVLWISARKDLLSGFFGLATMYSFLSWQERGGRKRYWLSVFFFLLALGSKVTIVMLPLILLLLLRRRTHLMKSLKNVLPFFVLAIIFGIVAIVGKETVGSSLKIVPMILMAFRSVFFYLTLIIVPAGFSAMHSLAPASALRSPLLPLSIVVVCGLLARSWSKRKQFPHVFSGVIFFLIILSPSFAHYARGNGFFVLGSERYVYLASAGIFFAIASLWTALHTSSKLSSFSKKNLIIGSVLFLLILGYLSMLRVFVYENAIIFNLDILQKNPRDSRASFNLGMALEDAKRPQEAEKAYSMSILYEPNYIQSLIALGSLLMREGRTDEAREFFQRAIESRPDSFKGYFFLGLLEEKQERFEIALKLFRDAERNFPDYPEVHVRIATVLGKLQRFDEAIEHYKILTTLDPTFAKNFEDALRSMQRH